MFSREGMEAVNARSVAKALNCSTQPIFSYYAGMEDLKNTLEQKADETFGQALTAVCDQQDPVLRLCTAYVRFASQEPRLFAHLFMRLDVDAPRVFPEAAHREEAARQECEATGLSAEQAQMLIDRVTIYAHGLATLMASGRATFSPENAEHLLAEAYESVLVCLRKESK
ncbi:MAG: TetR/AcrR family transcriptional regulator [Candidatus Ventricola sp.]